MFFFKISNIYKKNININLFRVFYINKDVIQIYNYKNSEFFDWNFINIFVKACLNI